MTAYKYRNCGSAFNARPILPGVFGVRWCQRWNLWRRLYRRLMNTRAVRLELFDWTMNLWARAVNLRALLVVPLCALCPINLLALWLVHTIRRRLLNRLLYPKVATSFPYRELFCCKVYLFNVKFFVVNCTARERKPACYSRRDLGQRRWIIRIYIHSARY